MRFIKEAVIVVCFLVAGFIVLFFLTINRMASSFSHQGSSYGYNKIKDAILFKTPYSSEQLKHSLDSLLAIDTQNRLSYKIDEDKLENAGCIGDSQQYKTIVYFDNNPKEIYFVTLTMIICRTQKVTSTSFFPIK